MPEYTYTCPRCDTTIDLKASMTHRPPDCPECHAAMVQQLHPPAIAFKGQGWTPKSGGGRDA